MNAPQLLETIRGRGGKITVALDQTGAAKIQITPRGLVGDLAGEIARFKPLILKILATAPDEKAPEARRIAPERAQTDAPPNLSPDAENGPQIEIFDVDGAAEISHLARVILECVRPNGAFDFGAVKPYWRAANELTGVSMDSPTLATWARSILAGDNQ